MPRAAVATATTERAREVLGQGTVQRLFHRDGTRIVPVPVAAIERFEASDDFVVVHTAGRTLTLNLALGDVEPRLDPRLFVRVHRSHVINLDHVIALAPFDGSRFQITLRSGTTLLSSRQRSRALRGLGR